MTSSALQSPEKTPPENDPPEAEVAAGLLDVVVCGSFRREPEQLRADFSELQMSGARVLSPAALDFVAEDEGFVYLASEVHETPSVIEDRHLAALRAADFVWLHAPGGYLGPSGSFELGVAHMAGVPVFCREAPDDVTLRTFVRVVPSPVDALEQIEHGQVSNAGAPLAALQSYYGRAAGRRGWNSEGPIECMLLLTEEVGELARAIRRGAGIARHGSASTEDAAEELADIQLYLVHLANVLHLDLAAAVTAKERQNARRALLRVAAA
jgi:NTP pyrophosphatase (non-canonical NTP hydrolase)